MLNFCNEGFIIYCQMNEREEARHHLAESQ